MENWLSIMAAEREQAILAELRECNDFTVKYGLRLSEREMRELAAGRDRSLSESRRVEFGRGILKPLITIFCDSPFIDQKEYAAVIQELLDIFYYFKEEAEERLTDHELLTLMKRYFDLCEGELDYLANTNLAELCRDIREGGLDGPGAYDLFL